eukprot:5869504-Karenia_brevis.AAC.1
MYEGLRGLLRTGVNSKWKRQRQRPLLYDENELLGISESSAADLMLQHFSTPGLADLCSVQEYTEAYAPSLEC